MPPINAEEVTKAPYLRMLILGAPKIGKTTTTLMTCEKPAYVINCDDESALLPAARKTKEFVYDNVVSGDILQKLESAIGEARKGVKEGRYKTIVLDTITVLSRRMVDQLAAATDTGKGPDGRRYWPEHEKRLVGAVERLFLLKAHVIVLAHYIDVGGEAIEGQMAKIGPGIAPLIGGKAKATIPALFGDVVFFELSRDKGRVFLCSIKGCWGPGTRSLDGVTQIPADVMGFYRLAQKEGSK